MKKKYNFEIIEKNLYKEWKKNGYFKPNNKLNKSYCIILPPPNITGYLHIGHAFQHTIMDILIRYNRMKGKNTLWQIGTDHAGIATQILVEKKIYLDEGKRITNYNRKYFIKKIWKWKKKYGNKITNQIKRLGSSVDWNSERFTMDDKMSYAVKKVFIKLYNDNLIYRGNRLVNWDSKLKTAISDLEIEYNYSYNKTWYIRYFLYKNECTYDGFNYLVVYTTRPETIFGDVALSVNPKDKRYKNLIGKFVLVPIINKIIPIIGDYYTEINKGTGCVKITPSHDYNDYDVGYRNSLPIINIFNKECKILKKAIIFYKKNIFVKKLYRKIPFKFIGLDRFIARKKILFILNKLKILVKFKLNYSKLPYSNKSNVIIEPLLTKQWYIRTKNISKLAINAVKKGSIKFIPKKYQNMYFHWMKNIKDWCISRQLLWGHRIPSWYDFKKNIYVGYNENDVRIKYKLKKNLYIYQDKDVMDTWFSSCLWIFASLGWPEDKNKLNIFYPTNVVVSGFDIIFFWIARMIMFSMYIIKDSNGKAKIPFKKVFITGLIKDEKGNKMSKSKGNVIDPIDIIDGISLKNLIKKRISNMINPKLSKKIIYQTKKTFPLGIKSYGIDALRFTMTSIASNGSDIKFDFKRLAGYRNFCNKLWNASRFIILNVNNIDYNSNIKNIKLFIFDEWILLLLNNTVKKFNFYLNNYRFDLAAEIIYEFTWNQFCDWYIEFVKKLLIFKRQYELIRTKKTLIKVLKIILCLLHPIIPFITEYIWKCIKNIYNINSNSIMIEKFPSYNKKLINKKSLINVNLIKKLIITIRKIKYEFKIKNTEKIFIIIKNISKLFLKIIIKNITILKSFSNFTDIILLINKNKEPYSFKEFIEKEEILFPIKGLINTQKEINNIKSKIKKIDIKIKIILFKIQNFNFYKLVPKNIILKTKNNLIYLKKLKEKNIKKFNILNINKH
ncbi:MAG: valine--tRNA ligase [Candidatus Makana argininalis]